MEARAIARDLLDSGGGFAILGSNSLWHGDEQWLHAARSAIHRWFGEPMMVRRFVVVRATTKYQEISAADAEISYRLGQVSVAWRQPASTGIRDHRPAPGSSPSPAPARAGTRGRSFRAFKAGFDQ